MMMADVRAEMSGAKPRRTGTSDEEKLAALKRLIESKRHGGKIDPHTDNG